LPEKTLAAPDLTASLVVPLALLDLTTALSPSASLGAVVRAERRARVVILCLPAGPGGDEPSGRSLGDLLSTKINVSSRCTPAGITLAEVCGITVQQASGIYLKNVRFREDDEVRAGKLVRRVSWPPVTIP
jgi:hypothetical protein